MSSEAETDSRQLKGVQLVALGICIFVFVVVGGLLVLNGSGGLPSAAPASQVPVAPK